MTFVMFGEGRRIPAMGAADAKSGLLNPKVGRVEFNRGGEIEEIRKNVVATINPGETAANKAPGGGGYGDPFERPVEKVVWDVKNDVVSIEGAREDYGVVIADAATLQVDQAATQQLRAGRPSAAPARSPTPAQAPAPVKVAKPAKVVRTRRRFGRPARRRASGRPKPNVQGRWQRAMQRHRCR